MHKIFIFLMTLLQISLFAGDSMVKANGIDIHYETFGDNKNPTLLLIMGGCCPGLMWPQDLCEKFAQNGFYVIRYDHRDTGDSTCIDFEKNPYDLLDMAKDAKGLLDVLNISKAHLFGMSMGGPIAELLSVHYPEKIQTITIMATSPDFRPMDLAYAKLPQDPNNPLSSVKQIYLDWMDKFLTNPPQSEDDAVAFRVEGWHILSGFKAPFDEENYQKIHREYVKQLKCPQGIKNHLMAILRSEQMILDVPHQVKVPTLILHGTEDPIFPSDHGDALAKAIPGSTYLLVPGMGHVPNSYFYDLMINNIKKLTERTP